MTIVNKEVVREESKTLTVKTCDVCGVSKNEMPDTELIKTVASDKSRSLIYEIHIHEFDRDPNEMQAQLEDEWVEEFDTREEAHARLTEIDMDFHSITKRTVIETEWDLWIDVCKNCEKMLFGAIDNEFTMKNV